MHTFSLHTFGWVFEYVKVWVNYCRQSGLLIRNNLTYKPLVILCIFCVCVCDLVACKML